MKLNIEQGEIKRILEMHSRMKKTLSEQAPELKNTDSNSLRDELQGFVNNNCIPNGKVVEMGGTDPNYKWAVEQESTKTPGKKRYFFKGGIVGEFINNKWVPNPLPWKCGEKSDLKQAFISKVLPANHKVKLTPSEVASGQWREYVIPGSVKQFPPNGIIAYSASTESNKNDASLNIETEFSKVIKDQTPPSKSKCKGTIRLYYEAWRTKKDVSDIYFNPMKQKVQACVNEFDGKWGGVLSKIDDYVTILQGGQVGNVKGPLTYGGDSKWRLN